MKIRIASYNVENLFERPAVMNLADWAEGKPTLDAYGKLNNLLQKPVYSAADKTKIVALLKALGLGKSDDSRFVILRQNRGHLLKRPKSGPPQVIANGRGDWIGWLELKWETVDETAVKMTGRVIRDVAAQIQGVVEVESRVALTGFNKQILGNGDGAPFAHNKAAGAAFIVVMGDFNDTPDSDPLAPLLTGSDLKDIQTLPGFNDGGRPGTFGNGAKSNKIDFLLLSPALSAKAQGGGIFRNGIWGGTNGTLFEHYPEITRPSQAASDHAAIFADLQL